MLRGLLYAADLHSQLYIMLKASLKHVPMAGWAMQLWDFIFIDQKNWDGDRRVAGESMRQIGRRAVKHKRKVAMLLFPEGTLVSRLTRPGTSLTLFWPSNGGMLT